METCANCDRTIGKLETPFLWQDEIVCQDCHARLQRQSSSARPTSHASLSTDEIESVISGPPSIPPEDINEDSSPTLVCPTCGSTDVKRAALVHDAGTSQSIGGVMGDISAIGVSVSQSGLARRYAPPRRPLTIWALLFGALAVGCLVASLIDFGQISTAYETVNNSSSGRHSKAEYRNEAILYLVLVVPFVLLAWYFARVNREKLQQHSVQIKNWSKSWVCMKCGATFYPR